MAISVRQLNTEEWALYKAIRLRALQSDPAVFGSSYDREAAYEDRKWQEDLAKDDLGVFGVFDDDNIIGMTGIFIKREDPSVAGLWGSWLEKSYRAKGISFDLYQARLAWAKARPALKRIIVSHRESNVASKNANQKQGFIFTHSEDHVWHDGVSEPEHFYELRL